MNADAKWERYTRAELEAMARVKEPGVRLADWIGPDGKLLVVRTLDSGKKHWIQYDKKHRVYRFAEKERLAGRMHPNGVVDFSGWRAVR